MPHILGLALAAGLGEEGAVGAGIGAGADAPGGRALAQFDAVAFAAGGLEGVAVAAVAGVAVEMVVGLHDGRVGGDEEEDRGELHGSSSGSLRCEQPCGLRVLLDGGMSLLWYWGAIWWTVVSAVRLVIELELL